MGLNEETRDKHVSGFNGLQAIKILTSQFLEAVKNFTADEGLMGKLVKERPVGDDLHMQNQVATQIKETSNMPNQFDEVNKLKGKEKSQPRDSALQLQQIFDAEPVARQNFAKQEVIETEAPS